MKRFAFLLAIILTFVFCACGNSNPAKELVDTFENQTTSGFSMDRWRMLVNTRGVSSNGAFEIYNLDSYAKSFPINELQVLDQNHVFAVSQVGVENDKPIFVYHLFSYDAESTNNDCNKRWVNDQQYFFVSGNLTSKDFSKLKVGDSGQDVYQIDPSVQYDQIQGYNLGEAVNENYDNFDTYRLLKDGVLHIRLTKPRSEMQDLSEFSVSSMAFYDYESIDGSLRINDTLIANYAVVFSKYQNAKLPE